MGLFDWLTGGSEKGAKVEVAKPALHGDEIDAMMAPVQRMDTYNHRRAEEAAAAQQFGPPVQSKDLMTALGHYADCADPEQVNTHGEAKLLRQNQEAKDKAGITTPDDPNVVAQHLASHEIHNHYMINSAMDAANADKLLLPEDTKLDLSSPDAKLKALNNLTQNQVGRLDGETQCATSSMVAAAMLADGKTPTEGLARLMNAMDKNAADDEQRKMLDNGLLKDLRGKLKKGDFTVQDIHRLEDQLYAEMHYKQDLKANKLDDSDPKAAKGLRADGIQADTISSFMDTAPDLRNMMKDNNMQVSFIDNNGANQSPHAVLQIGNTDGKPKAVYDPEMRDEGQIVTGQQELSNYQKAQLRTVK